MIFIKSDFNAKKQRSIVNEINQLNHNYYLFVASSKRGTFLLLINRTTIIISQQTGWCLCLPMFGCWMMMMNDGWCRGSDECSQWTWSILGLITANTLCKHQNSSSQHSSGRWSGGWWRVWSWNGLMGPDTELITYCVLNETQSRLYNCPLCRLQATQVWRC